MAEPLLSATPSLHLRTLYRFDAAGRIVSTLEPQPAIGPTFTLIRGRSECVWAVGAGVESGVADELDALAEQERPLDDWREPPRFADRYRALLRGELRSGPALEFPDRVETPSDVSLIDDAGLLQRHFRGWTAEEMPGRTPMAAVLVDGHAVSLCACARCTNEAAEASLETAGSFRGRGLAQGVTAAWAVAVRASGRVPLYSTSWENAASLAVARKLGLSIYAASWSLYAQPYEDRRPSRKRSRSASASIHWERIAGKRSMAPDEKASDIPGQPAKDEPLSVVRPPIDWGDGEPDPVWEDLYRKGLVNLPYQGRRSGQTIAEIVRTWQPIGHDITDEYLICALGRCDCCQ